MKKLIIALSIATMSQASFAFDASRDLTVIAVAEIIVSTAVTVVTSEAMTISTSQREKLEAQKIQMEVQEYNQSGLVSPFLANKIGILKSMDSSLSTEESVDLLVEASALILNQ